MCGRTANGVKLEYIVYGCQYQHQNKVKQIPEWIDPNNVYKQSYNQSPTNYLPVLISKKHLDSNCNVKERILMPMRWGLIPSYFKDSPKNFKLHTINCRADRISESKIYNSCFRKGRRCVIIVEGYYEWKKTDDTNLISDKQWKGPKFLNIAGLFDVCKCKGYELLYSNTIITVEAHSKVKWCHTRMPAILKNEEEVEKWLDYENYVEQDALKLLKPFGQLNYHQVDTFVNNWRNQGVKCALPCKNIFQKNKNQTEVDVFFKKTIKSEKETEKNENF